MEKRLTMQDQLNDFPVPGLALLMVSLNDAPRNMISNMTSVYLYVGDNRWGGMVRAK